MKSPCELTRDNTMLQCRVALRYYNVFREGVGRAVRFLSASPIRKSNSSFNTSKNVAPKHSRCFFSRIGTSWPFQRSESSDSCPLTRGLTPRKTSVQIPRTKGVLLVPALEDVFRANKSLTWRLRRGTNRRTNRGNSRTCTPFCVLQRFTYQDMSKMKNSSEK